MTNSGNRYTVEEKFSGELTLKDCIHKMIDFCFDCSKIEEINSKKADKNNRLKEPKMLEISAFL